MRFSSTLVVATVALGTGLGLVPAAGASVQAPGRDPGTGITASAPGKATKHGQLGGKVRTDKARGGAKASTSKQPSGNARVLRCWNGRRSGRVFTETCSGRNYRPYVDCSNRHRYFSTVRFSGTWNFRLTCPVRTRAVWGGAVG